MCVRACVFDERSHRMMKGQREREYIVTHRQEEDADTRRRHTMCMFASQKPKLESRVWGEGVEFREVVYAPASVTRQHLPVNGKSK